MSKKHNPGSKKPGAQRRRKGPAPATPGGEGASAPEASPVIEGKGEELNRKKKNATNPLTFFQQVRAEGEKVTWTSRNETTVSTIMVLVMVAIMGLFFFIVDQILRFGVSALLSLSGS
ncbi:MAG: preprotein translocase subunit SecE [Pseudomonadota bacterium]